MSDIISKKDIVKNIFKNKIYRFVLLIVLFFISALTILVFKLILPAFYSEMMINIVDEAKRVGKHIARHQDAKDDTAIIHTAIEKLKDDFGIAKIKLFDKDGYIVFSTEAKDIGTKNKHDYFYENIAKGKIFYKIANKGTKTLEDKIVQKDVAEIYVPIIKNSMFTGASEIYYDITEKRESLNTLVKKVEKIYILFSFVFLFFVFMMLYIASKLNLQSKVMEMDLFQKSKMASLGEMLGNIAHQWRQPLSAISMSASSIRLQKDMGTLDDKMFYKSTEKIITSTKYLSSTIDDFRNFFKKEKESTLVKVREVVDSTLSIVSANLKNSSIVVIIKSDDELEIEIYQNELKQVLLNILNNAKDILNEKSIKEKYIFIEVKSVANFINISIEDNAGGIPAQILNKIFDPYFTTKHQSQGTGIGLYMSLEIIEKHLKGSIDVTNETFEYENEKYTGAKFSIFLPKKI